LSIQVWCGWGGAPRLRAAEAAAGRALHCSPVRPDWVECAAPAGLQAVRGRVAGAA
jgi:hypothetical protein